MHEVELLALLLAATAVGGLCRRFGVPGPLLLVLVGLAASFLPGVPAFELDPEIVLVVLLPPLLYAAAWETSYLGMRVDVRPIALLSVGAVLFTTLAVGLLAWLVVPGLPLAVALTLGAIVSPPDAVAATAVGRSVGLPRRLMTILAGESLVNDATALTAYRLALAVAAGAGFSVLGGSLLFAAAAAGGVLVGLAVGAATVAAYRWLRDPVVENTVSLLAPFVAFVAAEQAHVSGVLGTVVAGVWIAHRAPRTLSAGTRLQGYAVWEMIVFILECSTFALIGLQLRGVVGGLEEYSTGQLAGYAAVVLLAVLVSRFLWLFPATYLPLWVNRRRRAREGVPPWQWITVLSWSGMRGVVSLAAAFAIPLTTDSGQAFPGRDLVVFLTFTVVIGTLVLQGFTLPTLIRRLGVTGDESFEDSLREAEAQHRAARAALDRLDSLVAAGHRVEEHMLARLRSVAELRSLSAWERLGGGTGADGSETPSATYRRLRSEMIAAERAVLVAQRDAGRLPDEVLRRAQRELDLEEAALSREP